MKIIVSKDIVKLNENHSENHYGEYNVNECVFEFDEYFGSVPIKKAIFTSQSNNKSFEIDIINNKCTVPHEVLTKVYDTVILGVYGYDVNGETLLVRYSPEPTTFVVHEGSYREGAEQPEIITPTQYDIYSKALQEGLTEVDKRLDDVEKQGDYASEQGDYAKEQGDYAKEQGTNAKNIAEETEKKAQEGAFDGKSLEFVWEGTKLGVRLEGQEEYHFVDLQGVQGEIGATGEPFKIKKTYASVSEMNADFRNMEFGDYVMIASSVEVEDNAKLYTKGESAWIFISDFSGAMGIRGETGLTPNIKIGEVKTLEAGSQASVTRSGNNEEPVFNFELPKGDKGDNYVLTEEDKVEIGEKVNTEYEERITENEKDIVDIETYLDNLTPKSTAKGELVHITDALPLATFENKVDGNVKQETTKGNQLFDVNTITSTEGTISDGVITSKTLGNWGTITWKFPNIPLSRTTYYVSFDLRIKSGTCKYLNKLNMWDSSIWVESFNFIANPTPSNIYQRYCLKFDLTNNTTLYNLNSINIQVGDIVVDAILEVKDIMLSTSSDYTYEKFTNGASPNPEYPQEIEVLEGYNLFDKKNANILNGYIISSNATNISASSYGKIVYMECEPNTSYSISKLANRFFIANTTELPIVDINIENVVNAGDDSTIYNNYVTSATAKYLILYCYYSLNASITFEEMLDSIQIIKGTKVKQYVPYGCVSYEVNGKNLFDVTKVTLGKYIDTNGSILSNQNWNSYLIPIKVKPNTTYCWSRDKNELNTSQFLVAEYDKNGNFIKQNNSYTSGKYQYTITTTENTNFVYLGYRADFQKNDLQFELGDKRTTFEPYKEQIVSLDLKGNWVGKINDNIKDYLVTDKKKFWLVKNVDKVVLNGSEDLTVSDANGLHRYLLQLNNSLINSIPICNYFIGKRTDKEYNEIYIGATGKLAVYYDGTLEEYRAFLKEKYDSGEPMEVYYPTQETEIIELGELPEPIKTFEGVNNIQLLANLDTEIEVKYALDVKKYFENKLASIQEQIL